MRNILKAAVFSMTICAMIFTLCACLNKKAQENTLTEASDLAERDVSDNVSLALENADITPEIKELKLIYHNDSDDSYVCGKRGTLEKSVGDVWYLFPSLPNVTWDMLGYELSPRSSLQLPFALDGYYAKKTLFSHRGKQGLLV
jgi:hypothetical protein